MPERLRVSITSILSSSTNNINFDMLEYDNAVDRRLQPLKSLSGGTVVDLGFHDEDRQITGKAVLSEAQASTLKSMFEGSTSFWNFSDGTNLYQIAIRKARFEKMMNTKYVFDCLFLVKQKDM